ncbi:nuclear pore complex protein NUP214 [Silene latifolia]|uniref:nuclear pore complex protein NUP214 n=1 Tax=Silene latifolia TaxID=37657 RepID=UPI003D786FCD
MAELSDSPKTLQITPIEGEHVETDDYFFCKVGAAIPLTSDDDVFDTDAVPSKPLVLSPRFGLVFAAHSTGFCVAKTKDVYDATKEIKVNGSGSTVKELSIVDVDIGRVSILCLSDDSSCVSAVVGNEIHFFAVDSLLNKDQKPMFSCSVEANHVKDMLWIKDTEQSFIVLTDKGKVHLGAINKPLTTVMDEVDAVEKSLDGKCVAVGRKSNLIILSSQFKEILQIVLPMDSFIEDNSLIDTVKVDSIRWVRSDSIVVGCVQQNDVDEEENYFLQVIMSDDGKFINDCSTVTAVQFNDLFPGIVDDIVPYGCGPHLFMNYLDKCEFAFVSNRKNTDQHIMLFSWSEGDNRVSVVDIERENWLPRIELKENGDDNVLLGLCVDETSVYENVEVKVRVEEQRELRPHCLLVCLTLEGKLVLFNVASISGYQDSSQTVSSYSDNVKSIPQVPHSSLGEGSHLEKEIPKQFDTFLESHESNAKNINSERDVSVATPTNGNFDGTLNFEQDLRKEPIAKNDGQRALMGVSTSKLHENLAHSRQDTLTPFSLKDSHAQVAGFENWKAASPDMSLGQNMADTNNEAVVKTSPRVSHNILTPEGSNSYLGLSGTSTAKSSFFSPASASTKSNLSGIPLTSTNTAQNAGTFSANVGLQLSDSYNSSTLKAANHSQKTTSSSGVSEMAHSIPNSTFQSREPFVGYSSTNHSVPLMKANHQSLSSFRQQNAEKNASEQFGNVQDMANELDKLLESIEQRGGFRDSCKIAHSSLETLEESMRSLLERSRVFQNISEERLRETEILLDKTVQVEARKTLMEGIVRQTTDVQYLDLWDRQKLNCELDQKQQSIVILSQDLVNKIIELERHFNALELDRFGESTGANLVSRAIHCRSSTSRNNESLNAIHNSTVSQLAAAQQLSDVLSRQMDLLSVKSPPSKQVSVKKKVFETIGIPLPDDSLISPCSPLNKHPVVSSSGATHNGFKKSQSSSRSSVLESSRRRRDSLDRNWAKFEAPITTVKRMSIQNEGHNGSGLFSSVDKPFVSPLKLQDSMANHSRILSFQDKTGGGGTHGKDSDSIASSASKWVGAAPETSQLRAEQYSRSQPKQGNNISTVQDTSSSSSPLSFRAPEMKTETSYTTAVKSGSQVGYISKPGNAGGDRKPFEFQWGIENSTIQNIQSQPPSSPIQYNQMLVPSSKETKSTKLDDRNSSVDSTSKQDIQFSSASSSFGTSTGSSTFEGVGNFATSGKVFKDASKDVSQIPSSSFPVSSSPAAPMNPILSRGPLREDSRPTGSSVSFAQDSLKGTKPADKVSAATNLATSSQSSPELASSSGDKLKSEGLALSSSSTEPPKQSTYAPAEKQSTNAPTEKQSTTFNLPSMPFSGFEGTSLSKNSTTAASSVASSTAPEIQSSVFAVPSVSEGTAVGKKNFETTISQEDEMEEEAPETNQNKASDFSLGSLAGFGIGSAVSSTAPKSNPFGVSLSSMPQTTPTSSPFTVPEGQLFRPASFNLQSPVTQQSQSPTMGPTSGGFGATASTPQQSPPAASGFGQPGQVGFGGQQVLGSVLGSFGQSRQIGAGLPASNFGGSPSSGVGGFGIPSVPTGGFAGVSVKTGGFAGVSATSGGFAGIGATASGFAAAAAPGGGFAGAAPSGGGFAPAAGSGGFGGGGFGAFSNQGTGGFSAPGGGATGGVQPPSQFTQMRR